MPSGRAYESMSIGRACDPRADPLLCYRMGRWQSDRGETDKALEWLYRSVMLRPGWAEPYQAIGLVCLRGGRKEEARRAFEYAVMIRPDFASARYNLGLLCLRAGDEEAFYTQLRILAGQEPNLAESLQSHAPGAGGGLH